MTGPFSRPAWYRSEFQQAERIADTVIDEAAALIRRSDDLLDELDAKEMPATDYEIDQFRRLVTGRGRTLEWEIVFAKIENGDFTWRDLAEAGWHSNLWFGKHSHR